MDAVHYVAFLIEQGKSREDAFAHARQRFGLTNGEIEQQIIDAREAARLLLEATEGLT